MQHLAKKQQHGASTWGPQAGLKRKGAVESITAEEPGSAQSQAPGLHLKDEDEGTGTDAHTVHRKHNRRHFGEGKRME